MLPPNDNVQTSTNKDPEAYRGSTSKPEQNNNEEKRRQLENENYKPKDFNSSLNKAVSKTIFKYYNCTTKKVNILVYKKHYNLFYTLVFQVFNNNITNNKHCRAPILEHNNRYNSLHEKGQDLHRRSLKDDLFIHRGRQLRSGSMSSPWRHCNALQFLM